MKVIVMAAATAFVLAAPVAASAQAMGEAVCNRPVSQEEMARFIETNDRRVLQIDCMKLVEKAIQQGHIPAGSDCKALGAYVRKLALVDIPNGIKISFSWVTPRGELSLTGFVREARLNEKGLLNNQSGIWYASTLCCNPFTDDGLPMPHTEEIVRPEPSSSLSAQAREAAGSIDAERDEPRGEGNALSRWAKKHGKKAAIVAAIGGAAAALLLRQRVEIDIDNSNVNRNQ